MKIAVCFSGVIRTGCNAYPNLLKYFGDCYNNIDVFVHTWDYEHIKAPNTDSIGMGDGLSENLLKTLPHKIIESKLKKFEQIWKPITMKVDSYDVCNEYEKKMGVQPGYNSTHGNANPHQLKLSLYECNKLKSDYEILHNFKYDYVVRIRPDMVIKPIWTLQQEIELLSKLKNQFLVCNLHDWEANYDTMINDVLYIAPSEIMDMIAEYGNPNSTIFFTKSLITYLTDNGIRPYKSLIDGYAILRNYALHLDSIDDYNQILIDEMKYHGSPEFYKIITNNKN
jgi:hypothetical protein